MPLENLVRNYRRTSSRNSPWASTGFKNIEMEFSQLGVEKGFV
jgi:hypothetical protein